MALIRSSNAGAAVQSAIVLDLGDLRRQAELVRLRAQEEAKAILEEARREAARLTERAADEGFAKGRGDGYDAGYAQGVAKGQADALAERKGELETLQSQWSGALDEFISRRHGLMLEAQADLVQLAIMIAERVIHRAIEFDPTVINHQLAEALGVVAQQTAVVVRVNSADLDQTRTTMPRILSALGDTGDIRIEADDSISPGGLTLRGGDTEVDARIETQLERIVEALLPRQSKPDSATATSPHGDSRPAADDTTPTD